MKSSLSLKVAFTYLSLFSLVLLAGLLFGQVHIARTQAKATAAHTARYQSYLLADELRQSSDDLTRLARTYVVTGDSKYERQYLDILEIRNGKQPRPRHYERIYWDFVAAGNSQPSPQGETASLEALMKQAGFSEQEFAKLKEAQGNSDALVKTEVIAMNAVKGQFDDGTGSFSRKGEPDLEMARRLMHDDNYHENKANIMKPVNEFLALLDERTGSAVAEAERLSHQAYLLMLLLQVVSVGVSLGALYLVYRFLMNTLGGEPRVAASVARQIAAGDLTVAVRLAPGDSASLLFAMQTMRDSLASIVGQVRGGTDTIVSAATQISSGNSDLSQRSEAQASNVEETAASMEELTGTVRHNAENARQANQLAASASEVARQGGAVVTAVVDTMSSINASSRKIVDIIAVIDGIAFQTNILALNAAVEAARAGEQGRGFAVVATEVRNLAQRSAAAAREIKTLIDDSVQQVDRGASLVGEAGETMRAIVGSVASVTDIMAEISAASGEQTAGIEQINAAIIQMDQATQQNAVLVEQAAAATSSLQDQAAALLELVSVFKLDSVAQGAPRLTLAPSAARGVVLATTPAGARARRA